MPPSMTMLTEADLQARASEPDTIIMKWDYDYHTPDKPKVLRGQFERLLSFTREHSQLDPCHIRERLTESHEEWRAFSQRYAMLFSKLTDPQIVQNESHVNTFRGMLDLLDRVERTELTAEEARSHVADLSLSGLVNQAIDKEMPAAE